VNVKYAFVGNTDRCPSSCKGNPTNAPNGNSGADGMASILAHELNEAVTDPLLDAWFDASGNETASPPAGWSTPATSRGRPAGRRSSPGRPAPSGSLAVANGSAGAVHFILDVNGYYQ
jgi:hypothetical protein